MRKIVVKNLHLKEILSFVYVEMHGNVFNKKTVITRMLL